METIMALKAEDVARMEARLQITVNLLIDWYNYFETDFRCGRVTSYQRMKSYLETMEYLAAQHPILIDKYRRETIRIVKERMNELSI